MAKPPPQPIAASREEAEALIGRIGELYRDKTKLGLEFGARLTRMKQTYDKKIGALDAEIEQAETKVRGWCCVNRDAVCKPGGKSARFATGVVKWRLGRERVVIANAEKVIAYIKAHGLSRFLRLKEEVNAQALLAERAVAESIPGVSIDRAPEEIVIEPTKPPE